MQRRGGPRQRAQNTDLVLAWLDRASLLGRGECEEISDCVVVLGWEGAYHAE